MITARHITAWALLACGAMLPGTAKESSPSSLVTCKAELDRAVLNAGQKNRAVLKLTLEADAAPKDADRPAVNLCLVLDKSGSMKGEKLERAKEAAIEAIQRLDQRDVFSLVVYDDSISTLVPASRLVHKQKVVDSIQNLKAGGNTAIYGAISQGASELRKNLEEKYVHRMVLLSDGRANVGPSSPDDLGRLGASLFKENISVTTVGLGDDYNEDVMTALAVKSDGNTYYVAESGDLPRIFTTELGEVLSVVATRVVIEVQFSEKVKPLRILGREGRIMGNRVEVEMNQLYGSQEKYVLVEVDVEPGEEGSELALAETNCRYEDALTQETEALTSRTMVTFSRDKEVVSQSENVMVQKEVILQNAALNRVEAIQNWENGDQQAAAQQIRYNIESYKKWGTENNDAGYLQLAEEESQYLQQLESKGLTSSTRKVLQTRNAQDMLQQKTQ